jgi:glycosyltransferase involved in cell wall biosynthesis
MRSTVKLDLSIVIPLYNEQESIVPLYEGLIAVLRGLNKSFEIIFINDGSVDDSYGTLCQIGRAHV